MLVASLKPFSMREVRLPCLAVGGEVTAKATLFDPLGTNERSKATYGDQWDTARVIGVVRKRRGAL